MACRFYLHEESILVLNLSTTTTKSIYCILQGQPGEAGLAGLPGLPGEDGAPGQKVKSFSASYVTPNFYLSTSLQ